VKYTTARRVAAKALRIAFPERRDRLRYRPGTDRKPTAPGLDPIDPDEMLAADDQRLRHEIEGLMREEAAVCSEDLMYRRTDWARDPDMEQQVRERLHEALPLLRNADTQHGSDGAQPNGGSAGPARTSHPGAAAPSETDPFRQRQGEER
jgi:glycerol-3-phosphate dehydrogenase